MTSKTSEPRQPPKIAEYDEIARKAYQMWWEAQELCDWLWDQFGHEFVDFCVEKEDLKRN